MVTSLGLSSYKVVFKIIPIFLSFINYRTRNNHHPVTYHIFFPDGLPTNSVIFQ